MLAIWGDNEHAKVYATNSFGNSNAYRAHYTFGTPPPIIDWYFIIDAQQYSLFCSYTPAIPQITNVQASPHTVGYGFNVTISANVNAPNGVNQVKVHIDAPEGGFGTINDTMTHTTGDTYQYVFSNMWVLGQYDYTIWVVDTMGYVNSSNGHHFHVSVNATISIATLQDSYTGNQYINITDPPDPPEELNLVGRGLTWNEYYNAIAGQNTLEVSTGPINYQEDNGTWTLINTTLGPLVSNHPAYVYGYRNGNDR